MYTEKLTYTLFSKRLINNLVTLRFILKEFLDLNEIEFERVFSVSYLNRLFLLKDSKNFNLIEKRNKSAG